MAYRDVLGGEAGLPQLGGQLSLRQVVLRYAQHDVTLVNGPGGHPVGDREQSPFFFCVLRKLGL